MHCRPWTMQSRSGTRVARLIADVYTGRIHPRIAAGLAPLLNLQLRAVETANAIDTTNLEKRVAELSKLAAELKGPVKPAASLRHSRAVSLLPKDYEENGDSANQDERRVRRANCGRSANSSERLGDRLVRSTYMRLITPYNLPLINCLICLKPLDSVKPYQAIWILMRDRIKFGRGLSSLLPTASLRLWQRRRR